MTPDAKVTREDRATAVGGTPRTDSGTLEPLAADRSADGWFLLLVGVVAVLEVALLWMVF